MYFQNGYKIDIHCNLFPTNSTAIPKSTIHTLLIFDTHRNTKVESLQNARAWIPIGDESRLKNVTALSDEYLLE